MFKVKDTIIGRPTIANTAVVPQFLGFLFSATSCTPFKGVTYLCLHWEKRVSGVYLSSIATSVDKRLNLIGKVIAKPAGLGAPPS